MANEQITEYVRTVLQKGKTLDDARNALISQGWQSSIVEESIETLKQDPSLASHFPSTQTQEPVQPIITQAAAPVLPASEPGMGMLDAAPEEGGKSFIVAFLFSFFFGTLGFDRFYLGYVLLGVLKLLTLGGLGIWSLIDIILLLANKIKSADGKALKGYKQGRIWAFGLIVLSILASVAVSVFAASFVQKYVDQITGSSTADNGSAITIDIPDPDDTISKPGISADGLTVSLVSSAANPETSGDAPADGKQYVEVVITAENTGSVQKSLSVSQFVYKTQAGGEVIPVNVSTDTAPSKNVELVGKELLVAAFLDPQQTSANSLLFEVPTGDKGTLVWRQSGLADSAVNGTFPL